MVLAAAVVLSLLATALLAASKNWQNAGLGDLSQYYETGNSADPGYVSTVRGDSGGTSYGIYMFASNAGTPLSFVQWLQEFKSGSIYRDMGDTLYNAYAYDRNGKYSPGYGSNFNATWRSVADDYPDEFMQSQKDYWETHAYADLLKNIKSAVPSFDLDDYSVALRNVFWSRSVHHGAGDPRRQQQRWAQRRHRRHPPCLRLSGRLQEPGRGPADPGHLRRVQPSGQDPRAQAHDRRRRQQIRCIRPVHGLFQRQLRRRAAQRVQPPARQ